MEVAKLSDDKIEILIQLYDSLVDALERKKEYDKKIKEQIDTVENVENELSDLNNKYNELEKNKKVISIDEAKRTCNILVNLETKKKQKKELMDTSAILCKEYVIIINEIRDIFDDIRNVFIEEEIETLSTNPGIKIDSLNTIVHIKRTDLNTIISDLDSIGNSIISETTIDVVNEIMEKFKENEEEVVENNSPHEMLIKLYNSRDIQKEENEELLSKIPKYIERNELNETINEVEENEQTSELKDTHDEMDSDTISNDVDEQINNNENIININTNEKINTDINDSIELPTEKIKVDSPVDSNLELTTENLDQTTKDPINLNVLTENVITDLNTQDNENKDENKIVGMPELDLPISNLTQESNINSSISEATTPTFEVPAPNIPKDVDSSITSNNNVPLNEEEVNSILVGNKVEESSKIANFTEAKAQTILKVWSEYKAPKTIIKNDENIVSLDAILSGSDNSKNTPQNDIQSFFSNAA